MEYHPAGRPRSFTDPQDLSDQVTKYFADCKEEGECPLMLELALVLGICRDTLALYARGEYDEHNEDGSPKVIYSDTFKRARAFVEVSKNKRLISGKGSTVGLIFDLKNNSNWSDRVESRIDSVVTTVVKKDMSTEEAAEAYSKQMG